MRGLNQGFIEKRIHIIYSETGEIAFKSDPSAIDSELTILHCILNKLHYLQAEITGQNTFFSLDNMQRNAINQCLSEYPKLLYYHGAHLNALREDCSLRNRKLESLGFTDVTGKYSQVRSPSLRNYLLSIGAGIGLDYDAYLGSLHRNYISPEENLNLLSITSEDYPAQLFIGADEKLLDYFQNKGIYRNGVDSVEKLDTLMKQEKLTEEDQDRLVNQALFARRLNIFNSEITRSLACVLGRLLYPSSAFHNINILKAYVDFYNVLIIAYHEKSATHENSSGVNVLQTVLRVGTGLNDAEFPKLLDAVEDVNRGMRLRR